MGLQSRSTIPLYSQIKDLLFSYALKIPTFSRTEKCKFCLNTHDSYTSDINCVKKISSNLENSLYYGDDIMNEVSAHLNECKSRIEKHQEGKQRLREQCDSILGDGEEKTKEDVESLDVEFD